MAHRIILTLALLFLIYSGANPQTAFHQAKAEIETMLTGNIPLNYERAIFLTENAYWDNELNEEEFSKFISFHVSGIETLIAAHKNKSISDFKSTIYSSAQQQYNMYEKALTNWAIFTYLTDTTYFIENTGIYYHLPYSYNKADPFGTQDWTNTQVNRLLYSDERNGNCYALTALFKIFSERLGADAKLVTTPGHIFIRHADDKGTQFNVELTTRAFPGTGSLSAITYTTPQAVKSGISLRTLNLKESVALTLVYLAKAYQYKFNAKADEFLLTCANTALQHDSLNLNAMLLKAEVLEAKLLLKNKSIAQLKTYPEFQYYEQLITKLFSFGYREMPKDIKTLVLNGLIGNEMPNNYKDYTPNAFEGLSYAQTRYATLSWGSLDEQMKTKPIEYYRRTAFNTATKKIEDFIEIDTINDYVVDMVVFALSIDPLAAQFPFVSPYVFVNNNPLLFVDPDGRKWVNYYTRFVKEKEGALIKNPNDKKLINDLKYYKAMESRVNVLLKKIETNDEALYNYIDNLQVSMNGKTTDVMVYVSVESGFVGTHGQEGQTKYQKSSDKPNVVYNDKEIIAPITKSGGSTETGFSIKVWDSSEYSDGALANEAGDVMYYMEYNEEATKGKSNSDYFAPGGGGMNAYMRDPASNYSNKVQDLYSKRKKSGADKNSNPYPLKKE